MEVDWDLHAVVRGCCSNASSTAAATTNSTTSSYSTSELNFQPQPPCAKKATSLEPFEAGRFTFLEELHELYKPFLHHKPVSSPPVLQSVKDSLKNTTDDLKRKLCAVKASSSHSQAPRSKKRKSIMKKVCRIPVEKLSSDVWAWRKYGQKPIKGSPHPRSYYKCSSSKGCLARRQVERDRSDPENFIVTYTAEHNHPAPTHRNSLAGSTRHKPSTPQADISVDSSSTATPSTASTEEEAALVVAPQSESREDKEDNSVVDDDEEDGDADGGDGEGESGSSEMALSDDFFVGLEGLMGPGEDGALFSDPFQSCFGFSWMSGGTVTAGDG